MNRRLVVLVCTGAGLALALACGGKETSRQGRAGSAGTSGSSARAGPGASGGAPASGGSGAGSDLGGEAGSVGGGGGMQSMAGGTTIGGTGGRASEGGSSEAGAGEGGASLGGAHSGGHGGTANDGALNLFVMFDTSWSMTQCASGVGGGGFIGGDPRCTTGPSRWATTSQALLEFVEDPRAAGLGVALRFFPSDLPVAGCDGYPTQIGGFSGAPAVGGGGNGGAAGKNGTGGATALPASNCDVTACAVPLVPLGRLTADGAPTDTQEAALAAAIQANGPPDVALLNPDPQTPTSAALAGAAHWASAYVAAHPTETTAIVLVTDGEPQGCDTSATNIARIAADAYATSAVRTYVIGLSGSNQTILDAIAAAGNTEHAFLVSDGMTVTQDLLASLNAIRQGAMP